MENSKDQKDAAEPPLDCNVWRCVTATANKPRGQVYIWTGRGFRVMTTKAAAIDEIQAQPFYAPNACGGRCPTIKVRGAAPNGNETKR